MTPTPFSDLGRVPSRVALVYAACAAAWIVLSDAAMALSMGSSAGELWANLGNGLLFVAASSGLMYVLLRRGLDRETAMRGDLAAKQERFNAAVAHLPFTFAIYDADRRFRFLNQQGLLIASKPLGEVLGRRDEEVFPPEMVNAYLPILNRALETRRAQTEVVEIILPSGHSHLAYTFTPLLNADGTVREVLGVTHDMTVVVRNERRVRRLNRTLSAISAGNSVLVRAKDEASLVRDFCAGLATHTQHRLVLVGLSGPAADVLKVAAAAGPVGHLVAGKHIGLNNPDETPDFCVARFTSQDQQPVICHDYQTEEKFAPCRAHAQAAGIRSAVGLPLSANGRSLGVLCLYAAEPGRFDDEEVRMLRELAEDLAFGLAALRQQSMLVATEQALGEQRRLLQTVMANSAALIYVANLENRFLYANSALDRALGQPEGASAGRLRTELMAPEPAAQHHANDLAVARQGSPARFEEANDEHGTLHSYLTVKFPLRDAAGKIYAVGGISTDITERKQAEAAHRELERLVQGTLDAMTDSICVLEADGTIAHVNASWKRFAAANPPVPAGATVGDNAFTACAHAQGTPGSAEAVRFVAGAQAVLRGEMPEFQMEYACHSPTEQRWFLARVTPFPAGGRPRVVVAHLNITAQKRAAEQVRDALAYLGTLLNASPVGIISYDEAGQARTANEAAARIVGASADQLLAQNFRQITSWQSSGLLAAAERTLERRQPEQVEAHFTTTFGKEVSLLVQFVPFQRGDGWHLLMLMSDISEQTRASAQLRLQSAALAAAANAIVITDAQGVILWVNPAFTRSAGYSLAEAVGQNPRLLKSGKHPRAFYEGMWKTILAGHIWHGEMRNRRKDGTFYDEEMTIAPVRDAAGLVTHFIAIKQDVTERKMLEQRFLRAQRLEGIGLLAGGIAHDLNNVLAPILMGADLLKMMAHDEATARQLESIVQSAQRGADIVKQVLTFARGIEGERVLLHPRHILKEMVRLARETFPRNIAFDTDIPSDLWPVTGDATQLHQVLLNLSVNARDALGEGGTLSYGAANVEVDDALARANPGAKPGPHVMLRVKDTGSGIPPAVLDRMFEPFFTTKEQGKGTGLGLSTVMGIVRSHGGFVTVSSELGRGTTFEVYLPASPAATGQLAAAAPGPPPRGHGELVLLVDDEPGILQVTRAMLERHGYRVLTAGDGTLALTELSRHPDEVALVITDILMPFMDGVQLIHALRRMAPRLKIIASSGALGMPGQKDRTDEVLALGVKHILHKPYAIETLLRTVHEELHAGAEAAGDGI